MSDLKDRYDKYHYYGEVEFYLSDWIPDIEQCRFILLKVVEQGVRDFVSLEKSGTPNSNPMWEESRDFIFDDEYKITWGDREMSLEDILDILDIDLGWFRSRARRKYREVNGREFT